MRTALLVFCALLIVSMSLEAKKRYKTPASQKTAVAKQHRAMIKHYQNTRKAPKHHQRVN